ncbi:MAG: hypothetical protein HYT62_01645 [Candidatus Yanofskybacteria bacterium]|nr:hypothetical protein [Candidatus Yanofskybacteria bacterium]
MFSGRIKNRPERHLEVIISGMKKILMVTSILAIVAGIVMVGGGVWGIIFTYKNVAQEKITTPADASIPKAPVLGPLTLKAQADIIRKHTLETTDGKVFAEMPRQIQKLDVDGKPVLDADGKPVMTANTARDMWITATTLNNALNLGIMAYALSSFILFLGLVFVWIGAVFCVLGKQKPAL